MRDEHIISILESVPFADLNENELAAIGSHADRCPECRRAFEAAQISALLLRERVAETFEPPAFFQTRVLAALREQQAASPASAFKRLWKATGALVTSMAATVAALAVLTFFAPGSEPTTGSHELASAFDSYAAEEVLLNQDGLPENQMSYGQVLTTLYELDEGR